MSAAETNWPAVTGVPLSVRVPAVGTVVTSTAARALAGLRLGEDTSELESQSELVGCLLLANEDEVPTGASLTAVTFTVRVLGEGSVSTPQCALPPLSWTWKVKVA